jgi:hypothetical protein
VSMKFRIYSATGERGPQVMLALRRGDVGDRLFKCLRDENLAKGFSMADLGRIDSGEFPVHRLQALGYTPERLKQAIEDRLEEIGHEGEELSALRELLHNGAFVGAMGGERARSRESRMIGEWKETVTGARKSMSDADIKKSGPRVQSASDVAVAHGWEPATQKSAMGNLTQYAHGRHPGHTVTVDGETQEWTHRKGAQEIEKSKRDATPRQCAASLMAHLADFHGV